MSQNLGILIGAKIDENSLNTSLSSAIAKLEKSAGKIDLKVGKIDLSPFNQLEKTFKNLSENLKYTSTLLKQINDQGSMTQTTFLKDGTKISNEFKLVGEQIQKMQAYTSDFSDIQKKALKEAQTGIKAQVVEQDKFTESINKTARAYDKQTKIRDKANSTPSTTITTESGNYTKTKITKNNDTNKEIEERTVDLAKEAKIREKITAQQQRAILLEEKLTNLYGKGSYDKGRLQAYTVSTMALSTNTDNVNSKLKSTEKTYRDIVNQSKLYSQNLTSQNAAMSNAIRLQGKYPSLKNNPQMGNLAKQLKALDPAAESSTRRIRELNGEMNRLHAQTISTARDSMTLGQQMQQAFGKFATWISATSAFYISLRGVKDIFAQILEIDKQMTEIARVTNGEENMGTVLKNNISIANELGNAITDVNNAASEFARQGFRGLDLKNITKVATLLSNISELDGGEASSILTAAMKGFNIEAEKAVHIVDALNEVNISASLYGDVYETTYLYR